MRALLFLCALTLAACGQPAPTETNHDASAALQVRDAWAAPTPNGVDVSAGYLVVANGGDADDRLLAATSPRAARVEVHTMAMVDGVMQMRAAEAAIVPAQGELRLAPGGMHLMFYGVTQPFAPGEGVPVTLTFEHGGEVTLELPVRQGAPDEHGH